MEERIKSFEEFYPFYLKQHSNKICRLLHIVGTTFVLAMTLKKISQLHLSIRCGVCDQILRCILIFFQAK